MTPQLFLQLGLIPALQMLPAPMDSREARAMVLAICLQESQLAYRRQMGGGPARSYAQFETGGVAGVLSHPLSRPHAYRICGQLDIAPSRTAVYQAIEYSDVLCAVFARLLLYTVPQPLPGHGDPDEGWRQYLWAWRPSKPHPETWGGNFARAWEVITEGGTQ